MLHPAAVWATIGWRVQASKRRHGVTAFPKMELLATISASPCRRPVPALPVPLVVVGRLSPVQSGHRCDEATGAPSTRPVSYHKPHILNAIQALVVYSHQ
jgi:hypothetical protein